MVVILRFHVPVDATELGRALHPRGGATVELESMVPSGEAPVPFFWIYASDPGPIVDPLYDRPSVEGVEVVERLEGATLIALEWDVASDAVFRGIGACDGHLLRAVCRDGHWEFTVRFPGHEHVSAFRRHCEASDVPFFVYRLYHGTELDSDPRFGLTEPQREALVLAVERGFYAIPRECSTAELADELGISAQAVTERLRRAVVNITKNTLLAAQSAADS